jgi:hypothetical protein
LIERYGYVIEHPDDAAERTVLGLVRGQHEVILGGLFEWIGIMTERYVPFLVWLYWRLWLTPEWLATMSKIR